MNERRSYKGLIVLTAVMMAIVVIRPLLQPKERIPWRTDLVAAKAEAQSSNKRLFLYFTATWCGPCQSLKHTLWADANVERAMQNFVPVKIDVDEHPEIAQSYASDGIPHFVVTSPEGKKMHEETGTMEVGEFLRWLERGN